jgi:hypothetical protein
MNRTPFAKEVFLFCDYPENYYFTQILSNVFINLLAMNDRKKQKLLKLPQSMKMRQLFFGFQALFSRGKIDKLAEKLLFKNNEKDV